jgi:hypothetical protein
LKGQNVTVTTNQGTADINKKWMLPGRPQDNNEFITDIKSVVNKKSLANNGHFIVADTNGQSWKFVIAN